MDVQEIATRIKRAFGDEAGVQITDDDIIRWVNDAQKEICSTNALLETTATANTIAGNNEVTLPVDIQNLFSVWYDGVRLEGLSKREAEESILKVGDPASQVTGQPNSFWIWANKLYLWPVPNSSGSSLKLFYTRFPVEVTTVTDTPELDPKYHKIIVDYCLQQAYELDEDWQASQTKETQVSGSLSTLLDDEKWTQKSTYPSVTVLLDDAW